MSLLLKHYPRLENLLKQRCFYLLLSLMALLLASAFLSGTQQGRVFTGIANLVILLTAIAAVQQSRASLIVAGSLGAVAIIVFIEALLLESTAHLVLAWACGAVFYAYSLVHLLKYVLSHEELSVDKLYGAVAAYVMLGIMWAFVHGVVQYFYPGAYSVNGNVTVLGMQDLLYFSFVILLTVGFGDILPMLPPSRMLMVIEGITGTMYVAILIARLTGIYPQTEEEK